ncbi:MAG: hypothetical protein ACHQF3_14055 [Alphaproteobacteria bacterium]
MVGAVLMVLAAGGDADKLSPAAPFVIALPVGLISGYVLGRWIGARCSRYGIATVILVAALGVAISRAFDFALVPSVDFEAIFGQPKSAVEFLFLISAGFLIYSICGLIGYWRGRQRRLARYLRYLLSILPVDTRDVLVNMAYEEAQRTIAATAR